MSVVRKILGPLVVVVAVVVALVLSVNRDDPQPAPARPANTSSVRPVTPSVTPTPSERRPADSRGHTTPTPAPDDEDFTTVPPDATVHPLSASQNERLNEAVQMADRFAHAFARPAPRRVSSWWARVKPFIATRYRADYAAVDPNQVGYSKVTGPGHVIPTAAPADVLTAVLIPTDAGRYLVELERTAGGLRVTAISRWRGRP